MVKKKKPILYPNKSIIKGALRRTFSRTPIVREVLEASVHPTKKGIRGGKQYVCAKCNEAFPGKNVQIDHIKDVIDLIPMKHISYDMLVTNLFCPKENLQVLCKTCHDEKTKVARELRKEFKKLFKYFVYETRNKVNGKRYRGVHGCVDLDDGYLGSGVLLKKAIKKYGVENFERTILFIHTSRELAYLKEKELVTMSIVKSGEFYNLKEGGIGGELSESTKTKISKTKTGTMIGENNPHYGKTHSEEVRRKIGDRPYLTGKDHPAAKSVECVETGEISDTASSTGYTGLASAIKNGTMLHGYHWRYVENHIPVELKDTKPGFRPVRCIDTGEVFKSLTDAANNVGLTQGSKIGDVCRGIRKTAKGCKWEFV